MVTKRKIYMSGLCNFPYKDDGSRLSKFSKIIQTQCLSWRLHLETLSKHKRWACAPCDVLSAIERLKINVVLNHPLAATQLVPKPCGLAKRKTPSNAYSFS